MQLFLDMDGVLMDFDRWAVKWGRTHQGPAYVHKPKGEWHPAERADDEIVRRIMEQEAFWTSMPPMLDAHLLWDWCAPRQPHVLTATPNNATYRDRCARNKYDSILTFFDPQFPAERFHACLRAEKRNFAAGNVLVDDNQGNCEEWQAAGGIAVYHKDAVTSLIALSNIFTPPLRAYNSAERKAAPVHTGVMLYFPDALMAVARVSKKGNDKHNPGEPLHWARGKSTDQSDCIARHQLTPDGVDPDSGETERAHAAWRALADLQLSEERRLVAAGIKPLSGIVP